MSRLTNIPETWPICKEAERNAEYLINELHDILNENHSDTQYIVSQTKLLIECVDQCHEIARELRELCDERGEKIQELEDELEELR